jgi:hypothetical protein
MKRFVPLALILLAACASGTAKIDPKTEPKFNVRVLAVPDARPAAANPFATIVEVDVANPSASQTLILRKIEVASFGQGRYTVIPASQTFGGEIGPRQQEDFAVRVYVRAEQTLTNEEEPLMMRVLFFFESPDGEFRRTYVQRVNPSTMK